MHPRKVLNLVALALALAVAGLQPAQAGRVQGRGETRLRPAAGRALTSRASSHGPHTREGAYRPSRDKSSAAIKRRGSSEARSSSRRGPARPSAVRKRNGETLSGESSSSSVISSTALPPIAAGTSLGRVLHVSQLKLVTSAGTHEQYVDADGDLIADHRTRFDASGGSFDVAVGRSGARYEVFTALDDRGTSTTTDDVTTGVLVVALDTNGDFLRDSSSTFDLGRDFGLPSAVSVVAGTSSTGREFVVVSSSGYYNGDDPRDPNNEPSPGVVLLVRDPSTGGFDSLRSREIVRVGDNRLFNANALALLPSGHLVIADFDSSELRVVRDTDGDRIPDQLSATPYYTFPYSAGSEDAPLDVASNSRGVVFTHSTGPDARMLAIYDTNGDGFADTDEICVEGLSIDDNLVLHGLTVGRDGTVYVIEDALGESDSRSQGGNGGVPRVDAFPDPALNGVLRDGENFAFADDEFTQALSGLSFGVETALGPVGGLTMTNAASRTGSATHGGLATILGSNLTLGRSGATREEAVARGVRVTIEGHAATVLSFNDSQIHVYVPGEVGAGVGSVVVTVGGVVTAAEDATVVRSNPGLFTVSQTGTGEAIALLVSGNRYVPGPFPTRFGGEPSIIVLFGTGWRNSSPVSVTVGGREALVSYVGASGGFPGLDQINVAVPDGLTGAAPVVVTTSDGKISRAGVLISLQ